MQAVLLQKEKGIVQGVYQVYRVKVGDKNTSV